MRKVKIIQASPSGTGSTVLFNIVYGLISPQEPAIESNSPSGGIFVTHDIDIDKHIQKHQDKNEILYFICSERRGKPGKLMPKKFHSYDNVLVIPFEDLNERENYPVEDVVDCVYKKIKKLLSSEASIVLNKQTAIQRIKDMNELYESIKQKPFRYYEKFYGLHGSHRDGKWNGKKGQD